MKFVRESSTGYIYLFVNEGRKFAELIRREVNLVRTKKVLISLYKEQFKEIDYPVKKGIKQWISDNKLSGKPQHSNSLKKLKQFYKELK